MPRTPTNSSPDKHVHLGPQRKVLTGWRRLLPCYVYRSGGKLRIRVFLRQSVVWVFALLILTYLAGGISLYWNDRFRHNLEGISLWDRLFPPRWEHYRTARGEAYLKLAQTSLQEGQFAKAFHQARAGLARAPTHLEGRNLVADMFLALRRPELAESTLLAGLVHHSGDVDYLQRTFGLLFQRQQDDTLIEKARELIPQQQTGSPTQGYLVDALAQALFYRGRFDQAEDVLREFGVTHTPSGRLLRARIEWDRGYRPLALVLIEQLAREYPDSPEIYRTEVQWLLDSGQADQARRASLMRRLRHPDRPQPRIDLLYSYDRDGDDAAVRSEAQAFLREFADNPSAVLLLGDFAANSGQPEIAEAVFNHARQHDMHTQGPALMSVESRIVAGRYQDAIALTKQLIEQNPEWEEQMAPVFNGLRAIAYHALGDTESTKLYLNSFLGITQIRAENLVAVANRLITVGARQEGRTVLQRAVRADALNQVALTRLIEFDLASGDAPELPANLEQLLTMRRPSPDLLRAAYERLGQDRYVFVAGRHKLLARIAEVLAGRADNRISVNARP